MGQYWLEALSVLAAHRARSLLTTLGLIIGVAAVIAIQILGSGMSGAVQGVLGSINDRSFVLIPNTRQSNFTRAALKPEDIQHAKRAIPNISEAIPAVTVSRLVRIGHRSARFSLTGESDARFITTPVRFGHALTTDEVRSGAKVAMLSDTAYARLYPDGGDPTGESLRVGDRRYIIVAVLAKPRSGILPTVVRGDIFLPYTTFTADELRGRTVFGGRFLIADQTRLGETEARTIAFFQDLKHGRAEYQTFDRKSFASLTDGIFGGLTLVVALIGAVSLLVAGIGILNIMLVSVAERTREIGLRKAIGATRFQVLAQFFIEALLLSLIGCGIGLVIGVAIGWAVNTFGLVQISGVVAPIPWLTSIAIATGFATLVTLAFGTYPAYRAATLDPIEALRHE
jgi:ABC-type antimicrobial peptide transport system permease subunit